MSSCTSAPEAVSAVPLARTSVAVRAALVAFPFLCPLVGGPSVLVWQLLATWVCVAGLLLAGPVYRPSNGVCGWLALGAMAIVLGVPQGFAALWLPPLTAMAAMAAAACVGAGVARGGPAVSEAVALGVLAAGCLSTVLGVLQYYGLAEPLVPWTTTPGLGQAYGNLRQRNQFATLVSMALVAALYLHAMQRPARMRRWLVAAAMLLLVGAAASSSRTGLLQLLLITAIAAGISWRERRGGVSARFSLPPPAVLLAMVPLYFALAWLLPQIAAGPVESMMARLQQLTPDDNSRLILWRNVLALIAERPFGGWGWGELAFAHYSTAYDGARFPVILDNAHNLPLHLAVELGVPVAVLICGGFAWMVLAARPWRERDPLRLMAWGMLGAITLHSLLEYPLWYGPFQLVFALCLGLLWPSQRRGSGASRKVAARAPAAAAVSMMLVVGYAGWDYIRISQIYLPREERLPPYESGTLAKARPSWLFARQVDFAELTLTPVTTTNAAALHALARRTMHFSPEPRVIVKLIESAELLGRHEEALAEAARFRAAFPAEYQRWVKDQPAT